MSTDPDTILLEAEESMTKAVDYLKQELRGLRSGRASTALVEYVKVEAYGSQTDLKSIASISVPEPSQLLVKPFDPGTVSAIKQGIENSGLGLNPIPEGKQLRITIPPLSQDRRKQMVQHCKKMGEEQKVAIRNARRDANKKADGLAKQENNQLPEDEINTLKDEIQELLKKYEAKIDSMIDDKCTEIMEV